MDMADHMATNGSGEPTLHLSSSLNNHVRTKRYPNDGRSHSASQSTSSLDKLINSGSYVDHRNQSDPFRSVNLGKRRSGSGGKAFKRSTLSEVANNNDNDNNSNNPARSNESPKGSVESPRPSNLPLTNRNLQHLLRNSVSTQGGDDNTFTEAVALDMEKFAREQSQLARSSSWHRHPYKDDEIDDEQEERYLDNGENYSVNSLEFGGSNPSSDHSSDSTSLDDVCYYDYEGEDEKRYEWPNLEILEEFVKEELEEAEKEREKHLSQHQQQHQQQQQQHPQPEHSVNFGQDVVHEKDLSSKRRYAPPLPPSQMKESQTQDSKMVDETTPLVVDNVQTNELESLASLTDSIRIRPPATQPWEKSKDQIPTILKRKDSQSNHKKSGYKDGEVCRYTYFREDLPKTIYSPTIGGLLSDDPNLSIYDKLIELFRPNYKPSGSNSSIGHSYHHQHHQQQQQQQQHNHKHQDSLASTVLQTSKVPRSGNETPLPPSINGGEPSFDPFWLDVLDPTEEEMKVISRTFGIHPLTTEDIFLGEAREKVELFKSYYFICFTSFDVVYERRKQRAKEQEKKYNKLQEMYDNLSDLGSLYGQHPGLRSRLNWIFGFFKKKRKAPSISLEKPLTSTVRSRNKKVREGELQPLNMYMIVFKNAVISFHFSPTPHPINVRRRARMLKDYLTVSSDWICYALIDDITDAFAPMIETIETEVNSIEDAILRMHSGEHEDSDSDDSDDENASHYYKQSKNRRRQTHRTALHDPSRDNAFVWRQRSKSFVEPSHNGFFRMATNQTMTKSKASSSSSSTSDTASSRILGWKRKGDMLRRIGECRKRVMSVLRLLSSKADVIKGLSKRFNDNDSGSSQSEIAMYLGDIQDHIVTMIQALNHYEKLLARFHSNYLAQINIDMTKVNNDTNDVLGKITILGTIVLPINVVTGLWGMNCLVPGQDYDGLLWFWCIVGAMALFSIIAYNYARRVTGL
ncbi:uncharacterized protein LODBEIA_P49700 [Lodderomyces beijingensis]|uniref:Manganese resistance protein MNR2 n=1 Tax=Lodderomyces beijingensis TaxID=1775926 RepID=A0ABP0ZUD3_9ASCO